jgi:hypothetical protein
MPIHRDPVTLCDALRAFLGALPLAPPLARPPPVPQQVMDRLCSKLALDAAFASPESGPGAARYAGWVLCAVRAEDGIAASRAALCRAADFVADRVTGVSMSLGARLRARRDQGLRTIVLAPVLSAGGVWRVVGVDVQPSAYAPVAWHMFSLPDTAADAAASTTAMRALLAACEGPVDATPVPAPVGWPAHAAGAACSALGSGLSALSALVAASGVGSSGEPGAAGVAPAPLVNDACAADPGSSLLRSYLAAIDKWVVVF